MKKIIICVIAIALIVGSISACSNEKPDGQVSSIDTSLGNETAGKTTAGNTSDSGENNSSDNIEGKEAQYYPNAVAGYKTVKNEAFDFWFDLPEDWKAVDKSQNGDGYFIISDAADMDIRVYGLLKDSSEEEYYQKLSGKNGEIEDITFNDGESGKRIQNTNSRVYYIRVDNDTYICFYVNFKDNQAWYEKNIDKLADIAMSLRTRMEGPRLDSGSNKITLDDLKLGDIFINMPYQNVKKVMKAGLSNEGIDELGATILFYDDGTEIYIIDDTVYTMNVINDSYPTPKGLKVGDSKDRVRELYGEPDNITDVSRWGYAYDGYELFSIVIKDNKVSELQIDMVR